MSSLAWIPQLPAGPGLSLSVFAVEGSCAQDELFLPSIPWKAGDRSPKLPVQGCDPTRLCGRDTGGHWGSVAPCQGVGCHQWSSPAPCAWFICQDLVSLPCWALPELVAALVTAGAVLCPGLCSQLLSGRQSSLLEGRVCEAGTESRGGDLCPELSRACPALAQQG